MIDLQQATKKLAKLMVGSPSSEPAAEPPAQLKITPRPRPKLHVETVCPKCGTVLAWAHSLPRHMKTTKCKLQSTCVFV